MAVVTTSDFVGRWEVTLPSQPEPLQALEDFIVSEEKRTLIKLFGLELYNDYISDPLPFVDLDGVIYECGYYSESLKTMLLSFIYLRIQERAYIQATENGRIFKQSQNGQVFVPYAQDMAMYNEAVDAWISIQIYCKDEFKKFDGEHKLYSLF